MSSALFHQLTSGEEREVVVVVGLVGLKTDRMKYKRSDSKVEDGRDGGREGGKEGGGRAKGGPTGQDRDGDE